MTYINSWTSLHDAVISPNAYCNLERLLYQIRLLRTNLCDRPYQRPHDYEFRIPFTISPFSRAPDSFFICISSGEVGKRYYNMFLIFNQLMSTKEQAPGFRRATNMELLEAIDDLVEMIEINRYVEGGENFNINQLPNIFFTRERFEARFALQWQSQNLGMQ